MIIFQLRMRVVTAAGHHSWSQAVTVITRPAPPHIRYQQLLYTNHSHCHHFICSSLHQIRENKDVATFGLNFQAQSSNHCEVDMDFMSEKVDMQNYKIGECL